MGPLKLRDAALRVCEAASDSRCWPRLHGRQRLFCSAARAAFMWHFAGLDGAAKANGAGIAADPTLTDAWASVGRASCGKPPEALFPDTLGARCLAPVRMVLRPCGLSRICHRRSHRHPACVRAVQRGVRAEALTFRSHNLPFAETACLSWTECFAALRPEPSCASHSNQACSLSGNTVSHTPQGWSTCLRPEPCACRLAKCGGTDAAAVFKQKTLWYQGLAAFRSSDLLSRRQLESAPQPAIWQVSQP